MVDQCRAHIEEVVDAKKIASPRDVVFPVVFKIRPNSIFSASTPIVLGVEVVEGFARVGTPLCVVCAPHEIIDLGEIESMERDGKPAAAAKKGHVVNIKVR